MSEEKRKQQDIATAANFVSGENTSDLVNEIACYVDDLTELRAILNAVKALFLSEAYDDAMKLIKTFYLVLAYDYPPEIEQFNQSAELQKVYLMEFISDFEDLMMDFEAEDTEPEI